MPYETVQGDTWDMIAKKVYGNEMYVGFLMENNFELLDTIAFSAGVSVTVKELPKIKSDSKAPWR